MMKIDVEPTENFTPSAPPAPFANQIYPTHLQDEERGTIFVPTQNGQRIMPIAPLPSPVTIIVTGERYSTNTNETEQLNDPLNGCVQNCYLLFVGICVCLFFITIGAYIYLN
jgi:hypothetical protein